MSINLGEVSIESKLGEGSIFSFTLPVSTQQSIIRGLVKQCQRKPHHARIGVLSAHRLRDDQSPEELVTLLNDLVYPLDLVLESSSDNRVIIIGITDDLNAFRNRIILADSDRQSAKGIHHSELVLDPLGVWSEDTAEVNVLGILNTNIKGEFIRA